MTLHNISLIEMRKLEHWGEQVDLNLVNFEFPTKEMTRGWPKDTRLESIEIKRSSYNYVSSVRCTYSNDVRSPVFQKENVEHKDPKTIWFKAGNPIRKVQQSHSGDVNYIYSIYFLDKANDEIANYNPGDNDKNGPVFDIDQNEEIFGVYGVKDKYDYFTSFGFIVRTKPQP